MYLLKIEPYRAIPKALMMNPRRRFIGKPGVGLVSNHLVIS